MAGFVEGATTLHRKPRLHDRSSASLRSGTIENWGDCHAQIDLRLLLPARLRACATAQAQPQTAGTSIPGTFEPNRGPDGNSVFLDAPDGLILVDTGRHPAHRDRLLAYAARARPAGRRDLQHPLASRPQHRQCRAPRRLPAGAALRHRCDRRRPRRLPARQPRAQMQALLAAGQDPGRARGRGPPLPRRHGPSRFPAPDPAGRRIGGHGDRRPPAAGERRALRRDRGRSLDPRSRRAAWSSPATSSSPRCRSWTPPAPRAGAARSTRSPRRPSPPSSPAMARRWTGRLPRLAHRLRAICSTAPPPTADRAACIAGWRRDAARFIGPGREAMIDEMTAIISTPGCAARRRKRRSIRPLATVACSVVTVEGDRAAMSAAGEGGIPLWPLPQRSRASFTAPPPAFRRGAPAMPPPRDASLRGGMNAARAKIFILHCSKKSRSFAMSKAARNHSRSHRPARGRGNGATPNRVAAGNGAARQADRSRRGGFSFGWSMPMILLPPPIWHRPAIAAPTPRQAARKRRLVPARRRPLAPSRPRPQMPGRSGRRRLTLRPLAERAAALRACRPGRPRRAGGRADRAAAGPGSRQATASGFSLLAEAEATSADPCRL